MKVKLKRIISFMLIAIILVVGVEIYNFLKAPSPINPYSINSKSSKKKVLIATQKSDFKDLVVKNVIKHYEEQDIYISVIDVTKLTDIKAEEWDRIIIFSAIRYYKLNDTVDQFIKNEKDSNRIFLYNTSNSTQLKTDNIDTVTSASQKIDVDKCTSVIINLIHNL